MVTGVSHEKLQVFHRWISYAMFVLALIHTFPFIVYHIRIGDIVEQWDTSIFYWTGVVALLAQAWLTFASFGPLRRVWSCSIKMICLLTTLQELLLRVVQVLPLPGRSHLLLVLFLPL